VASQEGLNSMELVSLFMGLFGWMGNFASQKKKRRNIY
jgi:hypothetical protein